MKNQFYEKHKKKKAIISEALSQNPDIAEGKRFVGIMIILMAIVTILYNISIIYKIYNGDNYTFISIIINIIFFLIFAYIIYNGSKLFVYYFLITSACSIPLLIPLNISDVFFTQSFLYKIATIVSILNILTRFIASLLIIKSKKASLYFNEVKKINKELSEHKTQI